MQLKHIEHLEDLILLEGTEGYNVVCRVIKELWEYTVRGGRLAISEKVDGSPAIVFGLHPDTKQFFVSTKSVFNKTPVFLYNDEQIINWTTSKPYLQRKLLSALRNLPKILLPQDQTTHQIYQGDYLFHKHTDGYTLEEEAYDYDDTHVWFQPNLITYRLSRKHNLAQSLFDARFGIAVHTAYDNHLQAITLGVPPWLQTHRDVFLKSMWIPEYMPKDPREMNYLYQYNHHDFFSPTDLHWGILRDYDKVVSKEQRLANVSYVNKCIREETPIEGEHPVFLLHSITSRVKDECIDVINKHFNTFDCFIDKVYSGPEGYVMQIPYTTQMVKLVKRRLFSHIMLKRIADARLRDGDREVQPANRRA